MQFPKRGVARFLLLAAVLAGARGDPPQPASCVKRAGLAGWLCRATFNIPQIPLIKVANVHVPLLGTFTTWLYIFDLKCGHGALHALHSSAVPSGSAPSLQLQADALSLNCSSPTVSTAPPARRPAPAPSVSVCHPAGVHCTRGCRPGARCLCCVRLVSYVLCPVLTRPKDIDAPARLEPPAAACGCKARARRGRCAGGRPPRCFADVSSTRTGHPRCREHLTLRAV